MSATAAPSTLSILLDIELPLTLRFGKANLHLNDILELETESMVELDRPISEPVEVMINGRTVARGHVVEVEGNYAVRVTDVVSRRDRLNTTTGAI